MPRGGSKPGERRGGRKKGTPNHKTQALVAAAEISGLMPLQAMLKVMRYWLGQADAELLKGKRANKSMLHQALDNVRIAAKDAAPYLHASIKAQIQVPLGDAGKLAEFQAAKHALQHLVDRVATARAADGSPSTTH